MKKQVIRCTALLSALSLMALGQPNSAYQTSDSILLGEQKESMIYSEKSNDMSAQIRTISRLFDYHFSENLQSSQEKNVYKNSNYLNQNFGLISEEDFMLLCQLVAAEAENQPFEGKRAVAGVVLNRSEYGWPFAEGIEGAIFQEAAFSCVSDGRFYDAWQYVSEEDEEAVAAELTERKYSEYLYFTADHYGEYGTPAEQIGDHYFCTE